MTVIEARDRVGGRVLSASQSACEATAQPLVLDLGGQWVGPDQASTLGLIKQLGLHLVPVTARGRAIWDLAGRVREAGGAIPPLPPHALAEVLVNAARVLRMSKRIAPAAPWQAPNSEEWDQLTVEEWIRRHLRTTSGREFARMYVRGNISIEPHETSLLGILFDLRSIGAARNLATAETYRVREGAHEIARGLADRLGQEIRLGDPVRSITQDAKGVVVQSDNGVLHCLRVAVCIPPPLAGGISYTPALPEPRDHLMAGLSMAPSVKFHAVYRHPFWRARGLSGQAWADRGAVGLTYDNSPDDGAGRGVLVGLAVADEARRLSAMAPSVQEQEILESLERLFGPDAAAPDRLVVQNWSAEEWTLGCYAAYFPPGGWTTYGSAFRTPCGRVHWAGTETSSEWHGYMEGALRSGSRVAHEMLEADAIAG